MAAPINRSGGPRFDLPHTTQTPSEVLRSLGIGDLSGLTKLMGTPPPLPAFLDTAGEPIDPNLGRGEPLELIEHRRIRILSNYWHAGWERAHPAMQLRTEAHRRLCAAADALPDRFGFAVFDAYRPLVLQAELYDAAYSDSTLPEGFVAEPIADRTTPPPHSTGGTVDCTLTIDGVPLALGTNFDDFSDLAWANAFETIESPDRELRRLLYWSMQAAGFVVLHCEWWHFEFGTRRWAAITGEAPRYSRADPL
jgi:zinc D-Ala-D-Ala dipeptidase